MVDINGHLRIGRKDRLAQIAVHLLRRDRVPLVGSAGSDLETQPLVRIYLIQIGDHMALQLLKVPFLYLEHRADPRDPEHLLQRLDGVLIIVVAEGGHIDAARFLADVKSAFHILQRVADATDQGVLEEETVLALCPDLRVFDQK